MSWNIKKIGSRVGVDAAVRAEPYVPLAVKNLVSSILLRDDLGDDNAKSNGSPVHDSALVEGSGHDGGAENGSYLHSLHIELFTAITVTQKSG